MSINVSGCQAVTRHQRPNLANYLRCIFCDECFSLMLELLNLALQLVERGHCLP